MNEKDKEHFTTGMVWGVIIASFVWASALLIREGL